MPRIQPLQREKGLHLESPGHPKGKHHLSLEESRKALLWAKPQRSLKASKAEAGDLSPPPHAHRPGRAKQAQTTTSDPRQFCHTHLQLLPGCAPRHLRGFTPRGPQRTQAW